MRSPVKKGSHIRLTKMVGGHSQHITIPNHSPIKVGTLSNILRSIISQTGLSKEQILDMI